MIQRHWDALFPLHFGDSGPRPAYLAVHREGDVSRPLVERFVHAGFKQAHQADIRHFLPEMLGLYDEHGSLDAVIGLRVASSGPLFLEQYLDAPLEVLVSDLAGRSVPRDSLVEVGNLAALSAGGARLLIIATTWLLAARGLRWVAFTGATTLANSFHRLGLSPVVLGHAASERLESPEADWGTYYDQRPQVYTGDIGSGYAELERRGVFGWMGFPSVTENGNAA